MSPGWEICGDLFKNLITDVRNISHNVTAKQLKPMGDTGCPVLH